MGIIRNWGRGKNLLIMGFIGLVFFSCGILIALVFGLKEFKTLRHLRSLQELDAVEFNRIGDGTEVVVSGTLTENPVLHQSGLVAYQQQQWDVTKDSDGDRSGTWRVYEEVWPPLKLSTATGPLLVAGVSEAKLGGDQYAETISYGRSNMEANNLPDGSMQVSGFKNGDLVTIVGSKDQDGRLEPTWFYGGTRESMLKEQTVASWLLVGFGILFMFVGLIVAFLGVRNGFRSYPPG